jgi:hypothetical protein
MDGTRKALAANGSTEEAGECGHNPQEPDNSETPISCDLGPKQVFEKSEGEGRDLEREIASSLL